MEEDIFFAFMLSLVSRDPSFQICRGYCWVSCAEAVFCAFVRLRVWEGAPSQASLNDNTLATTFQLSRAVFYHTNANHYMKTRQKSFQWFKSLLASSCVGFIEHCSKAWIDQKLWSHGVFAKFFSPQTTIESHMTQTFSLNMPYLRNWRAPLSDSCIHKIVVDVIVGCTPVLPMVNRHRPKEAVFLSFNEFIATNCHDIPPSQN